MMIKKPFGKKVLSIILVIVIAITPFSYVKADTYTMDDVYYKLRDILTVLNGYGQNIPTEGINDQIQDLQDLFDTIFVDNTYSYVGVTGTVEYRTFMDLMQVIASMGYTIPSHIMEGYYMRDQNGILVHMAGVNENIANVLNRLNMLNSSSSTIISDLQTIITNTASILTTLNAVSTTLTSILAVDNNILNLETNFYNYIQNGTFKQDIDNVIDLITFEKYTPLHYFSTIGGTEITSSGNTNSNIIYVSADSWIRGYDDILLFTLNIDRSSQGPFEISSIELVNSNGSKVSDIEYYYQSARFNVNLYIYNFIIRPQNTTGYYLKITTNVNIYCYLGSSYATHGVYDSNYMYRLRSSDIEYWHLLSYFDLHRLLLDYESVNSSELDKLKQENQTFNTTLQNFNQLETQISTDFSNNLVTFNSNLTESTTMFNSLTNTVVWFSNQMQNIFNVSSDFKMLLIMPMILGIALWFIGRGGFILKNVDDQGHVIKRGRHYK